MSRKQRLEMYAVFAACATAPATMVLGAVGFAMILLVAVAALATEIMP